MSKPNSESGITVGRLARAAGVNVETVRYYQRIGLLPLPRREYGSIRRYAADDLKRIRFIKRAQTLGFSLEEVASLLGLSDGRHCAQTRAMAETRLAVVEEKIAGLRAIRKSLKGLVAKCAKGSRASGCPIIDALIEGGP